MATIQLPVVDLDDLQTAASWTNAEAASGYFESNEIWLDAVNKIFYFKGGGSLATAGSGVTGQALYSFFKERWKNDDNLPQYPFPMLSITNEQFEFQNGWKPADGELVGTTTASDITFGIATDDTIVSAADINFQTAGFTDADYVVVSGSTDNDGYYRVKSASGGTLTLEGSPLPGTAGADTATISIYRNAVYQGAADDVYTTRDMIRTAGWSEIEANGGVSRRYAGVVTLGSLLATDQPYYVQDSAFDATPTNTVYAGAVNQGVQFYGNVDYGDDRADDFVGDVGTVTLSPADTDFKLNNIIDFNQAHAFEVGDLVKITGADNASNNQYYTVIAVDSNTITVSNSFTVDDGAGNTGVTATLTGRVRNDFFKIFVRTRGKTYADADLVDIGVSELTYIVYRFPLTNADDLNINTEDDNAFTGAAISSIVGAAGTITVTTSVNHGLYSGAPVFVVNTGVANFGDTTGKLYTVAGLDSVDPETKFTISSTDTGSAATGTVQLGYTNDITIKYLTNPQTTTGDVVLRGDWTSGFNYNVGDVAFDTGNTKNNADGPRWYYTSTATGASGGGNMAGDTTNHNWLLWDPDTTFGSAKGGQRNIEEDADGQSTATSGNWSAYTVVIDGNSDETETTPGATKEVIYEYVQYKLRQTTDINDETTYSANRRGDIADPLVFFVGSTLNTYRDGSIPFAATIDDIAATDVNNIQYNEALAITYGGSTRSTAHTAPIVVTVTFNFNDNLANDPDAVFYAYYTTGENAQAGNDYGTTGAIELQKVADGVSNTVGSDVGNIVPTSGVYQFNYAYDADTTNGRAASTDVSVTVVAIGLERGQYVFTQDLIRETGGTFSLVAPLERNYNDPD